MMQTMRNSAKIVFFIVLVAFAGFMILQGLTTIFSKNVGGEKSAPPGVIGEIDDTPIPMTYFENAYRPRVRDLMKENEEPSEEELQKIRDEIWNNLITVTVLENEARRVGITITDPEIVEYMKMSPPQDLRDMAEFKTDGRFDFQKYQDWLRQAAASNDPQIVEFISNFENQIRQQLTLSRLQDFVISMERITPDEVKHDYLEKNEKAKVRYIFIPNSDFKETITEASDKDLRDQYEIDKEKYKNPAMASVSYVQFPKTPSDEDYAIVKVKADSLYREILAGADFGELAKTFSDDKNSGANGGDLGWFGEGMMVQPFWDATIKLARINDISEPVKTAFGWHIIKLTGKKEAAPDSLTGAEKYEYMASHILLKVDPSPQTIAAVEEKANEFLKEATTEGFEKTAKDYELEIKDTGNFGKDGYIQAFGKQPDMANFAFGSNPKDISKVISTRAAFVVCALPKQSPESIPSFDEVKDQAKESYLFIKRVDAAYERTKELAAEVAKGKSFEEVGQVAGKPILETDYFARHEFVPKVGSDPDFIGAAFGFSNKNPLPKAVKARGGAYLMQFVDRQEPDTAFFAAHSDSLIQDALSTKRKNFWPKYVNEIKTKAKIVDYRQYYYGS